IADETRLYAIESAPLIRIIFKVGDVITDHAGQSLLVENVKQEDAFYVYSGQGRVLNEADLGGGSVTHNIEDRLFAGDVDAPEMFALRRETLDRDYNRKISPVHG